MGRRCEGAVGAILLLSLYFRNPYLTNVRNTDSKYWRTYLTKPAQRCLVPVTSFAEPDNNQGPRSIWTWFAQDETRPLMFFAGIVTG